LRRSGIPRGAYRLRARLAQATVAGEGGPLPTDMVVEGLEVARRGTYDLLNVLVQSNGDLRLIVDDATRVVPVIRERDQRKRDESGSDLTCV
jgi:hypothetical protein